MADDKNKLIKAAQKFIQKGQLDRAIKEYEKVARLDPSDVRIHLKIGDLHTKKGNVGDATASYRHVAEYYARQGFYLKAVAVYKQILKLSPELVEVNMQLAELYQQLGLLSDSMNQYQQVAEHFEARGQTLETLNTLKKIVSLDPDNVPSRLKLADLYVREGMSEEAVRELSEAAERLRDQGRLDDYVRVVERLLGLTPENTRLALELAQLHLKRGEYKLALAKLQICFRANPRDISTLELLAQAFQAQGQAPKAISVYREMARIHAADGREQQRREAYEQILQLDPTDTEASQALGGTVEAPASMPPPPPMSGSFPAVPVVQSTPEAPIPPPSATPTPATHLSAEDEARVNKIITEADVYLKYGLQERAAEHLRKALAVDPQSIDARERLQGIYIKLGDTARAVEEQVALARTCFERGDDTERMRWANEALRLDPNHAEATALASASASRPAPPTGEILPEPALEAAPELETASQDLLPAQDPAPAAPAAVQSPDVTPESIEVELDFELDPVAPSRPMNPAIAAAGPDADDDGPVTAAEPLELPAAGDVLSVQEEDDEASEPPPELTQAIDVSQLDLEGAGPKAAIPLPAAPEPEPLPEPTPEPEIELDLGLEVDPAAAAPPEATGAPVSAGIDVPTEELRAAALAVEAPEPEPEPEPDDSATVVMSLDQVDLEAAAPAPAAPSLAPEPELELESAAAELDEVTFFVDQGIEDMAVETLQGLREAERYARLPADEQVRVDTLWARLQGEPEPEAEPEVAPEPVAEAPAAPTGELELPALEVGDPADDIPPLYADSDDADGPSPDEITRNDEVSVDDLLAEFKAKAQAELGDDPSAHFDMAVTYKSMGLADEAIAEFEQALALDRDPVECLHMMTQVELEREGWLQATRYAKRALQVIKAAGKGHPRVIKELYYYLGQGLQGVGDRRSAITAFKKIASKDPGFLDVAARLQALQSDGAAAAGDNGAADSGKAAAAGEGDAKPRRKKTKISYV